MLIAAIGDTHFRVDNISIVDTLIGELLKNLKEKNPDLIVLLGDILHDHERLHTIALNRAYHLIKEGGTILIKLATLRVPIPDSVRSFTLRCKEFVA